MTCTAFLLSLEMNRMFISRTDIEQTQNVIFFPSECRAFLQLYRFLQLYLNAA